MNGKWLVAVLSGSSALAVLGLSQVLAIGALSVLPLGPHALSAGIVASLVTATIGTICCVLISRTPGEICGPRTSIAVIYAALCADLVLRGGPDVGVGEVMAGLSLAVVLMGVLQLIGGWARAGEVVKFLPHPVNAGFVTGVGLLVVWSQIAPLLGLEKRLASYDWGTLVESTKPWALLVGLLVIGLVWATPRVAKRAQPLLVGLIAGTLLSYGLTATIEGASVGRSVGAISIWSGAGQNFSMVWRHVDVEWLLNAVLHVLPYSFFLAVQGIIGAVLNSAAVANVTGARVDVNRVIVAQGLTNMLCGLLGALPVGSSPSQSVVAAKMRDVNAHVPWGSALMLLVAVAVLGPLLAHIPIVVLAALLITAGFGLVDGWTKRMLVNVARNRDCAPEIKWNLAIVIAVASSFFFGNVPLALTVGAVMAVILLLVELSSHTTVTALDGPALVSRRAWPAMQQHYLTSLRSTITVFRPRGGLFFATADQLAGKLERLGRHVRYCVIDCSRLTLLDATGCRIIASSARRLAARGVTTVIAGIDRVNAHENALVELGLDAPSPKDRWFHDLDHALEWIEIQLLSEPFPEVGANRSVALEDAQLAKGLTPSQLNVLRPYLKTSVLESGDVLFKRSDPGSSIYIINSGLIEIRIDSDQVTPGWRRMAVLGPGCIFGEVAMLTGGHRSADAVCVQRANLFELSEASLNALNDQSSAIHSRILANLGMQLATRLIAATDIARNP